MTVPSAPTPFERHPGYAGHEIELRRRRVAGLQGVHPYALLGQHDRLRVDALVGRVVTEREELMHPVKNVQHTEIKIPVSTIAKIGTIWPVGRRFIG